MLALPDVLHRLPDKLAGLRGGGLSFPLILLRAFDGLLLWHIRETHASGAMAARRRRGLQMLLHLIDAVLHGVAGLAHGVRAEIDRILRDVVRRPAGGIQEERGDAEQRSGGGALA